MRTQTLAANAGAIMLGGFGYLLIAGDGNDAVPEDIAFGNGRIEAVQVDVSTKFAGRVQEVVAKEGDLVQPRVCEERSTPQ